MSLGIVYRLQKKAPLTFEETDGNWRKLEDAYDRLYRLIPIGTSKVLIQPDQPVDADKKALWIKTDAATGVGLGSYLFNTTLNKWDRIEDAPIYFSDTGTINELNVTTGEGYGSLDKITGKLFLIKVLQTNTGSTSLTLDTLPTLPVRRTDGTNLIADDLKAGMVVALVFDGTNYQALNLAPRAVTGADIRALFKATEEFPVPFGSESVPVTNPLGVKPVFLRVVAVCQTDNTDAYMAGDEVDITGISADQDEGEVDACAFTVSANASVITVAANLQNEGKYNHYAPKTGGDANFSAGAYADPPKWKLKAYVF